MRTIESICSIVITMIILLLLTGCVSRFSDDSEETVMFLINEEIKDRISPTEIIIIRDAIKERTVKTIVNKTTIQEIIEILSRTKDSYEFVTSEGNKWVLLLYDSDYELIAQVLVWEDGHISFNDNKEYFLSPSGQEDLIKRIK